MPNIGILLVGAVALGLLVIVPLIAILTEHQRKMAELVRKGEGDQASSRGEIEALRQELRAIKEALQILAVDSGRGSDVKERLEGEPPPLRSS